MSLRLYSWNSELLIVPQMKLWNVLQIMHFFFLVRPSYPSWISPIYPLKFRTYLSWEFFSVPFPWIPKVAPNGSALESDILFFNGLFIGFVGDCPLHWDPQWAQTLFHLFIFPSSSKFQVCRSIINFPKTGPV